MKKLNENTKFTIEQTAKIPPNNRIAGERLTLMIDQLEYATFRWCPAGTFLMGSPVTERNRNTNERQHHVTFSRGFWILETPVTQTMWESVMGDNPSLNKGMRLPVENLSWYNCLAYIKKLNDMSTDIPSLRFYVPTEAEWEYACRAGTTSAYHFGNTISLHQANFEGKKTSDVGFYLPNDWGISDMHGNVWEWSSSWNCTYPDGPVTDPEGPSTGTHRVVRGGGWNSLGIDCRSAERLPIHPALGFSFLGLRLSIISE